MRSTWLIVGALAVTAPSIVRADVLGSVSKTKVGAIAGQNYTARSTIVGQGSTASLPFGGSSAYLAQAAKYNGVVGLVLRYANDTFVCSGSLLSDRRSIATAAHCVSNGGGVRAGDLLSTTALFFDGSKTFDPNVYGPVDGVTEREVSNYFVNSLYTGEVVDQNDIAVLTLGDLAPDYATSYELFGGDDLTGKQFNVVGYGNRSTVGGEVGIDSDPPAGVGRRRQGDNTYDFRLGDDDFNGFFDDKIYYDPAQSGPQRYFGTADVGSVFLSDFDDGLAANDASCRLGGFFGLGGSKYCGTGLGFSEVSIAGGDSGGPGFVNGQLASINSFGLTFGTEYGDVDDSLNSSWGEFNGFVPTSIHRGFIEAAMAAGAVPEPATWMQMILGFAIVGFFVRVRRRGLALAPAMFRAHSAL